MATFKAFNQTFKVKDVEEQARLVLLDTQEDNYRFEPKEIHAAMLDALERIRVVRPVSRYVCGILVDLAFHEIDVATGDVTTSVTTLPPSYGDIANVETFRNRYVTMERRWLPAVVYYVIHRMYMKDDPDTKNDELSRKYLELHTDAIGG